jgi:hypothetical protein
MPTDSTERNSAGAPAETGVHCPLKAPNALLADFIQFYAETAAHQGNRVDVDALRGIASQFLRSHPLHALGFSVCRRLLSEAEGRSLPPFDRIVVEPLRPLLPRFGGTPGTAAHATHPMLSRRIIPGVINAICAMLGQERADQFRRRAEDLASAHLSPSSGQIDWPAVFADPENTLLLVDLSVAVVDHFADFPRRLAWLMAVVDSHLPPATTPLEREWNFTERHALALLMAISRPLRRAQAAYDANGLANRHGLEAVDAAAQFFRALDAAALDARVT